MQGEKDRRKRSAQARAVRERIQKKRKDKKRYGTQGIHTSKGLQVAFGYTDHRNVFHTMKPSEYVKKVKELTGKPPVHELLLQAQGISSADREYIEEQLAVSRMKIKRQKAILHETKDLVENGMKKIPKPETETKKGKTKK